MYKVENGPITHYLTLMSWGDRSLIQCIDPTKGTTLYFKLISKAADKTVVVLNLPFYIFTVKRVWIEKAPLLNTYFFRVAFDSKTVLSDVFKNSSRCSFGFSCAVKVEHCESLRLPIQYSTSCSWYFKWCRKLESEGKLHGVWVTNIEDSKI